VIVKFSAKVSSRKIKSLLSLLHWILMKKLIENITYVPGEAILENRDPCDQVENNIGASNQSNINAVTLN
jgi:hypothetical protein